MIIKYPTGLYKNKFGWLTSTIIDLDRLQYNITWYISSFKPPRIMHEFSDIDAETRRSLPEKSINYIKRREAMGQLIFMIRETHNFNQVNTAMKKFSIGQVLEEDDIPVDPINVVSSNRMETRHNTNQLDTHQLLKDTDINVDDIITKSNIQLMEYNEQLNNNRAQLHDWEIILDTLQKHINELTKMKKAVRLVEPSKEAEIDILIEAKQTERTNITNQYNDTIDEVELLKDKIRQVGELVR